MAIQDILNTIKGFVSTSTRSNSEFKSESARNNRNVSSAIRDISKMFASQKKDNSDVKGSLKEVIDVSQATYKQTNENNALLRQSISIQSEMLTRLKEISSGISSMVETSQQQSSTTGNPLYNTIAMATSALGLGAAVLPGMLNEYFKSDLSGASPFSANNFAATSVTGSTGQILDAIKSVESGGDYSTPNKAGASSASGAYQFVDGTWQSLTQKYGIGTEYKRAMFAPPEIQDAVAAKYVEEILAQNNNDVSKIPLVWYTGNAQGQMSSQALAANRGQDASAYQQKWMKAYSRITGGSPEMSENEAVGSINYPGSTGVQNGPQSSAMGGGGNVYEMQATEAAIRKLPISEQLKAVLKAAAAAAGVDVYVTSGGQPAKGSGQGPRTGSTRHDNGNAADLYLTKDGRKLKDPEDRDTISKFISAAVQNGATGIGFGGASGDGEPKKYMGDSHIHVGFGRPATWGGSPILASAASGISSNSDPTVGTVTGGAGFGSDGSIYGQMLGFLSSGLGALGFGGLDITSLLSAYFGVPFTADPQQPTSQFEVDENETMDNQFPGRSTGVGGATAEERKQYNQEKDFVNYEKIDPIFQKIQEVSLAQQNPIVVNNQAAPQQEKEPEVMTDFGLSGNQSRNTRASWAPRIAVLRPDDDATSQLRWSARISKIV